MKRFLLIIGAILLGFAVRAQSVTYTCRYWFDQNFAQAVTTTFGESGWEAELEVGSLTSGLHSLHLHVMDTSMKWSAPQSYLFLKIDAAGQGGTNYVYHYWFDQDYAHKQSGTLGNGHLLLDVDELTSGLHSLHLMLEGSTYSCAQSYLFLKTDPETQGGDSFVYHCWFDQDFEHQQSDDLGTGHLLLDVADLEEGMHTVHVMLEGTQLTTAESYLFMKVAQFTTDTIDMSHLAYHCWFDEDFGHQQIDSLGTGHLLLDVNDLEDGLHTVHVMLQGNTLTATQSYIFMKMAVENPSAEMQYICWFDQDYGSVQTGALGSGLFELEVGDLSNGIHTVNVQLSNGSRTAPQSYLFYKQPLGGNGIARWDYWVNDDFDNRTTTVFTALADTLDIISLLPVGHPALRSSCFHFHPNGDAPYINAKNQINFRFWDAELRILEKSTFYVDEQVQQDIVAQVFERNTTKTIAAPRNNQIQWFKLEVVVGDSLSFIANKACTMQLFAPSGEEVYNVSGPESITLGGLHAWENGTYYLAVHDQTGSGETLSVTYQHLDKYVVLAYTPTEIGNTWGVFEMDVLGNGFDKLNNVILVNGSIEWQMDSIMYSHISEGAIRFAMDAATSNGNYDVVLCFEDQVGELDTLVLSNAIQVVEAQFGTIDIDYSYQFNTTPPYLITVTITNNGNIEYQGVPIMFAHTNVNNVEFGLYNDWITVQEDYFENGGRGIYYTNNLFNQGIEGNIIPLIIPRLGPHGTREITLNADAERGTDFDFYAWGGIPWSLQTDEAYNADAHYCQTHSGSPGWGGNHNGGNGGNSGSTHGSSGGSSGGASFTVGTHNSNGGNTHGAASDAYYDSCDGPPDPCDIASVAGDVQECLCGVTMGIGQTLGNMLNAMHGLNHRAQLNGVGIHSQEEAEQYGLGDMWHSAYHRRLRTPGSLLRDAIGHCTGMLPDDAQQVADAGLTAWGMLDDDCSQPPRQSPSIPRPCEPNEIRGYLAESGSHYMMKEIQTITYEIESENDTTATAAAHTIIVRDTLDVNKFDVASLAAYRVTIHDKVLELSGEHNFVYTLDLRPNVYVIAQIQLECDDETGIVVWTITSLDPMTMEPTTDPNQGALPINYNGEGIATFTFNVNLKEPFPDGTEISNRVGIIFDLEEPVITDTWTNTVDAVKPTSHIEEVTVEADTLNFSFVSNDSRSGVWYHSLYYRNSNTEQEWKVKKAQIFENSYALTFDEGATTEFLVMAVDSAGNQEEKEMLAEYIFVYDGPGQITQADVLAQGWNWWSTYLEQEGQDGLVELENSLGHNGLTIKSQNDFTDNFYQDMGVDYWYGSLESIQNEQGYLINVAQPCNTSLTGVAAVATNHPITIRPNWNWIGYPVASPQAVTNAMSGFNPSSDDVLKGQSDFTSYYEGYGWYPEDFMLVPGQSYLYCSNANINKTLTYSENNRGGVVKLKKAQKRYWNNNVHAFADNFNVIAVVNIDGEEQRGENLELGAFVNGECRGSARLRYFAPLDRYYAMLTITGQEDDVVEFHLVDTDILDNEEISLNQVIFKKNAVVGRLGKPYEVHFGEGGLITSNMAMYPNPVEKGHEFSLDIPHDETIIEIVITDALGTQVRHEAGAVNAKSVKGLPAAGVYVIKAVAKSGTTYHGRLIVE
ncbi:MAG: T9SS type A sorting domain-containing protein [Bacteroidales bacterium]|nr:T9SS type A sorting domain-containing protein [Bacteroidales bacterium]